MLARRSTLLPPGPAVGGGGARCSEARGKGYAPELKLDASSVKGIVCNCGSPVSSLERTISGGADHRPGLGSEVLRRRVDDGQFSFSARDGLGRSCPLTWICGRLLTEDVEGNRRIRILGCREGWEPAGIWRYDDVALDVEGSPGSRWVFVASSLAPSVFSM